MDFLSEAQSVRADKLAAPNVNVNLNNHPSADFNEPITTAAQKNVAELWPQEKPEQYRRPGILLKSKIKVPGNVGSNSGYDAV